MREDERDRVCRQGTEAWKRLKKEKSWGDWLKVGEALQVGREWAMNQAGIADHNRPAGKAYNMAFGEWMSRYKLDDMDKGDRSRLFAVMDNLGLIEEWRKTLTLTERLKLNHPNAVWRKWKAAHEPEKNGPAKPTIRDALVESQEENARLKAHIAELEAARKPTTAPEPESHPWTSPLDEWCSMFSQQITQARARLNEADKKELFEHLQQVINELKRGDDEPPRLIKGKRRRNTPDDTRRKLDAKKAEQAKPVGDALVWKERGGHAYEAAGVQGTYTIVPSAGSMGYRVQHWPTGVGSGDASRTLSGGVEAVEDAKAIAQADHDEGKDTRP